MSEPLIAKAIDALQKEDFAGARAIIVDYERENPLALQHYQIRGLAELALKDWQAAQNTFSAATLCYPDNAILFFNLGMAQENLGDLKNAAINYEHSLKLNPDYADACGNLSNLYRRMARFGEAEKMAQEALRLGAPRAQALNSLGLALDRQNKKAEARMALEQALRLEPNNVLVLCNLANFAVDRFDFDEAWRFFAAARETGGLAIVSHHEGMARLLTGDYAKGWKLYEARLDVPGSLRIHPPCPLYRGENPAGKKLLLVAEQGFGDAIQFCRYGNILEQRGASLIWAVPKGLQRLFAASLPGQVLYEKEPLPEADFFLPILSLPLALGLFTPQDAQKVPYLRTDASAVVLPETGGRKIGLVWAGSKTAEYDFERSIHPSRLEPLWEKVEAKFYALFIGEALEQAAGLPVMRLDHLIKDFADTAALLEQIDILVTVDTAVAHLAGALGIKTCLLLRHCSDWHYGLGETTPWYPSIKVFRQPEPGNWDEPIARVAEFLATNA